ncbi:MAG: hypothetical protein WCD70_07480, partial [Alphaproteobacteria bacterium]
PNRCVLEKHSSLKHIRESARVGSDSRRKTRRRHSAIYIFYLSGKFEKSGEYKTKTVHIDTNDVGRSIREKSFTRNPALYGNYFA